MAAFRVSSLGLNLRSAPRVASGNRLALLPFGQAVERLEGSDDEQWWQVRTVLQGASFTGYVASRYLAAAEDFTDPQSAPRVRAIHLAENRPDIRRDRSGGRAYPLGEPTPRRDAGDVAERREALAQIIRFLDVERSARYAAAGGATYCNIYAYDFCYLAGAYLPRVWWTEQAIADLQRGVPVAPIYDRTVTELNANSLYNWLQAWGADFDWRRVADVNTLQQTANQGSIGVICAQRTDPNSSGHIAIVVPEEPPHQALYLNGLVDVPLQCQAGATNHSYTTVTGRWWTHGKFRAYGFWVHD